MEARKLGKPIDQLGMGPTRKLEQRSDGTGFVDITPPAWSGFSNKTVRVELTAPQVVRYLEWLKTGKLIQQALPDLSVIEREKLLSGLDDEEFHKLAGDDDEEDV